MWKIILIIFALEINFLTPSIPENKKFIIPNNYLKRGFPFNYYQGETLTDEEWNCWIRVINWYLKYTGQISGIPFNIKSHSFRINKISNLLHLTLIQNIASIVGHSDIWSTLAYKRYSLIKEEIQDLLKQIEETNEK